MKTAEEWFDTMITGSPDIKEVISEIQREAYNQAINDAAQFAACEYHNDYLTGQVDEQSILKLKI